MSIRLFAVISSLIVSAFISTASARDSVHRLPIAEAMARADFQESLGNQVRFFWAGQPTPAVGQRYGEYGTNKKTNAFNKTDREACEWVLLSALLSLRDRALREGGNAVINIKSNYKSSEFSSATEFECGAGSIMAGVALKGTVVTLP